MAEKIAQQIRPQPDSAPRRTGRSGGSKAGARVRAYALTEKALAALEEADDIVWVPRWLLKERSQQADFS